MPRLVIFVVLCSVAAPAVAHAEVVEGVVAFVDDDPIFLSELRERVRPLADDALAEADPVARQRALARLHARTLDALIDERLVEREAARQGVVCSDEEIARAVEQMRLENGLDEEAFWAAVEATGMTRAQYEAALAEQIVRARLLALLAEPAEPVTEEEVRREWERREATRPRRRRYRLSQVFVEVPEDERPGEREAARQRIETIHARLLAGELSFEEAMRAEAGEHVGWIDEDDVGEHLRTVLERTAPGGTTGVVESEHGFQIVLLHERGTSAGPTFDEQFERIRRELEQARNLEAQEAAMRRLREGALILRRLASPEP